MSGPADGLAAPAPPADVFAMLKAVCIVARFRFEGRSCCG